MSCSKIQIADSIKDLKENYFVSSLKTEFGEEGATFDEANLLKEVVLKAGLDLVVKIGGCEAVSDIVQAQKLEASVIVCPMIETSYALKKYIKSIKSVFDENELVNKYFTVNIETITGYLNFNEISEQSEYNVLSGIVIGRNDIACSLNYTQKDINNFEIYKICENLSEKVSISGKDFIVGGGVNKESIPFLRKLPYLTHFETRKVVFDSKLLQEQNIEQGLKKAIEFEMMWLKYKGEMLGFLSKRDELRLKILQERLNLILL